MNTENFGKPKISIADAAAAQDESPGPKPWRKPPSNVALLFGKVEDDLHFLCRLIIGLDMAAETLGDEPQESALRAIIGVVEEKITAMKRAMEEAQEALREQEGA
jgi:hypothetical protein